MRTIPIWLLLIAVPVAAQEPGDSVRLRMVSQHDWVSGIYVRKDSNAIILRRRLQDEPFPVRQVDRFQVWKRTNPLLNIFLGATAGASGVLANQIIYPDRLPFTGSNGGDVAVMAGGGAILGIIITLVSPGSWKTRKP